MASKFLKKRTVPEGFKEILSDLTREVLREQPKDIVHFAASYFEYLSSGKNMKFIYDKNHAIVSRANSRADTSNSHISEKKLTKEYVGQLYEYGIEKFDEFEGENENQTSLGELYINIVSAKDLKSKESNEETYCVAFLTSDPMKIIKTTSSVEAINPRWDHQDKLVLRNLTENDIYETFLIFQVYANDNGKILVGEANVDVYFALTNPGEWDLKLSNTEGEQDCGNLKLQVNFMKDTEANENEDDGDMDAEINEEPENSNEDAEDADEEVEENNEEN